MNHPYRAFLPELLKPARYLGAEFGVVRKDPATVGTSFVLAFPDTYEIGMSHLGLRSLYEILNAHPDLACERAFAPWADLEARLRATGLPLVSLETARPLRDFHVVGFSLQYELTFTNVLLMLDLGGLPLRARDRGPTDPLVIAGGPVASHPEPLAPFLDLVLVGDAERALPELLLADGALRRAGATRDERLAALAGRPGIYWPTAAPVHADPVSGRLVVGERPGALTVHRVWEPDLSIYPDTGGGPVSSIEAVFDRAAIEIARGCDQGCRFCQAGFLYRPLRERSVADVLAALERRAREGGYDEVALTALSTADYSALRALASGAAAALQPLDVSLSVSSLRAVGLDGDLMDSLRTGRAGGLTFAPEAGSQALRDRINKRISEAGLIQTAREAAVRGWTTLKLYFMLGLPEETDADVSSILTLAERVRLAARDAAGRRAPKVTCAVNSFVPKPHTPMQWAPMASRDELRRRQDLLRRDPLARRMGLKLHDLPMSLLEGVLARGDRRLADVVEGAYRRGARFDAWDDCFVEGRWTEAFTEAGIDPGTYLGALPTEGRLPWDHLHIGVTPDFLLKEWHRYQTGRIGQACGVGPDPDRPCFRCGLPCQAAPPPRAAVLAGARLDPVAPTAPAEAGAGAEPRRMRVFFAKTGPAAYLSHLDLVRHLPRILRRAGLRPAYTQGFNPKPRLQFGPPLPLGVDALEEPCDIHVILAPDEPDAALRERLARASLPGLEILDVAWLAPDAPALARLCQVAEYRWELLRPEDLGTVAARIPELLARPTWLKQSEPRAEPVREKDVRPSLVDLRLEPGEPPAVAFAIEHRPEGSLRPRDLLLALVPDPDAAGRLVRSGWSRIEGGTRVRVRP